MTNGLVPKGLELMLEPMIRNHDQNVLDNWYLKLKNFFIINNEIIHSILQQNK